ncbi:tetratricopeptide repeat protein [Asticcacaulis solisilvae]|uniref:tetratricopeptide repeat protein n=1 Tax=Asticcacaulis solisilvae TaxID=1217274 RepID=UPI003FD81121
MGLRPDLGHALGAGLVFILAGAACLPARAQPLVFPVYRSEPVRCGDRQSAKPAYALALGTWNSGRPASGDEENMVICAVSAALAGYAPAETLLGRILSHSRETGWGAIIPAQLVDFEDALYWYGQGADGGDGQGAAEAGRMYEQGAGTTQSDEKALALYRRAVALGYRPAAGMLASLEQRPARVAAFEAKVLVKAQAGDAVAMRDVARAYIDGDPYPFDMVKGFEWMRRAAEAGNTEAMVVLARMYRAGSGTERDDNAAADWLMKAWTAGARGFAGDINMVYFTGKLDEAHKRRMEAFSAEFHKSKKGAATAAPGAPEADAAKADIPALEKAARGGAPDAVFDLAVALLDGRSGTADPSRARDLLLRIADRLPAADMNLGDLYYTGKLGKPDMAEAAKWYAAAGAMGDGLGAKNAALIYRDGAEGVPADKVMAYALALLIFDDETGMRAGLRGQLTPQQRAAAVAQACRLKLEHYPT